MGGLLAHPWWLLALAAVGAMAIAGAFMALFLSVGDRPEEVTITEAPPVCSRAFLDAISGTINAPLLSGGSARLLSNGDEVFPAMLEAIRGAERSVNFSVYIWEPGEVGDRFFDALEERARAGVPVRLLLDGMGCIRIPREGVERLRAAGARVAWFRPLRFGKLTRFHKRNHRRAVVIDGRIGFTGGVAVGDKWMGHAQDPAHWRDMMVEVRGCVATNLQSAFTQLWSAACGEILAGDDFFPSDPGDGDDGAGEDLSRHVNVISSPSDDAHPLRKFFWTSFRCARERLYVTSPYFVPDPATRRALAERAREGVDVRILLPNELTDARPIRWASHAYYGELMAAGVRIWEFQPTFIHAKSVVVDGAWSVVGSANMDIRSRELNQENVIGILDRGFARQLEEAFLADLERAREIRAEEWGRRPVWKRAVERLACGLEEQY